MIVFSRLSTEQQKFLIVGPHGNKVPWDRYIYHVGILGIRKNKMKQAFEVRPTTDSHYPVGIKLTSSNATIFMTLTKRDVENFADILRNYLVFSGVSGSILLNSREGQSYDIAWVPPSAVGPRIKTHHLCIRTKTTPPIPGFLMEKSIAGDLWNQIVRVIQKLSSTNVSSGISRTIEDSSGCRICKGTGTITLFTSDVPCECTEAG